MPSGEIFVDIYSDHGCSYAPSCLNCPFSVCRYDRGFAGNRVTKAKNRVERDRLVKKMRAQGMQVEHIAAECGVSGRTVARILSRSRPSSADLGIVEEYDADSRQANLELRRRDSRALAAMGIRARDPLPEIPALTTRSFGRDAFSSR